MYRQSHSLFPQSLIHFLPFCWSEWDHFTEHNAGKNPHHESEVVSHILSTVCKEREEYRNTLSHTTPVSVHSGHHVGYYCQYWYQNLFFLAQKSKFVWFPVFLSRLGSSMNTVRPWRSPAGRATKPQSDDPSVWNQTKPSTEEENQPSNVNSLTVYTPCFLLHLWPAVIVVIWMIVYQTATVSSAELPLVWPLESPTARAAIVSECGQRLDIRCALKTQQYLLKSFD